MWPGSAQVSSGHCIRISHVPTIMFYAIYSTSSKWCDHWCSIIFSVAIVFIPNLLLFVFSVRQIFEICGNKQCRWLAKWLIIDHQHGLRQRKYSIFQSERKFVSLFGVGTSCGNRVGHLDRGNVRIVLAKLFAHVQLAWRWISLTKANVIFGFDAVVHKLAYLVY